MSAIARAGRATRHLPLLIAIGFVLAACRSAPNPQYAAPQGPHHLIPHPTYKIGAPYTIKGITYTPRVDYAYAETGIASWYGEAFDGQYTANGEVFDLNLITAAHRTLPLPSVVEVVNLQNNRALRVRVNDRGPFANGRILDVSRRVAQLLGFERTGTTMVRVRILKEESLQAAALVQRGIVGDGTTAVAASTPAAAIASVIPPPQPRQVVSAPSSYQTPPAATYQPVSTASAPAYRPSPAPTAIAAAPTAVSHRFFIQTGAFSVAKNAQRLRSRVASLGNAQVTASRAGGVAFYRVRVGPLATAEAADRLLNRMIRSGYRDARIVID